MCENPNPVIKRIAIKTDCEFASPALIGSGFGENTDNDILRDSLGKLFLPGSSVAGVLRSFLPDSEAKCLFGAEDRISPLWVLDSCIDGTAITFDGVALDRENKVALEHKKFDYEAITTGAKFTIRFLLTVRKDDSNKGLEELIKKVVGMLKSGEVSFGAKCRRGFGCVKCESAVMRQFDLSPGNTDELKKWIDFDWHSSDGFSEAVSEPHCSDVTTMTVALKLAGSVMIRDIRNIYEGLGEGDKEPDYKHISVGGHPVILGTSWAGAIRSGLYRLLKPKYENETEKYLNSVFGFVTEDDQRAEVSLITFGASTLKATDPKTDGYRTVARVKIDRFTGGSADGALFTEKPWFGGETKLEIRYPKEQSDVKELLVLALEGLDKGLIQIGGESAIGRGFFNVLTVNDEPFSAVAFKPKLDLIEAIKKAGEMQ
jgi:CRISPR/Cas system CSM-associated protein Csm3 (group 7 of RAMP superfamily)